MPAALKRASTAPLLQFDGQVFDASKCHNFQELLSLFGGEKAVKASLLMGGERSKEEEAAFRSDVVRLRRRLRDQNRGLINPRGKYVQYWDLITCFALLYTLFVTPYEVGMDLCVAGGLNAQLRRPAVPGVHCASPTY